MNRGLILISPQPALAWGQKCKSLFDNNFLFHRNPQLEGVYGFCIRITNPVFSSVK